jgi:LAO/AO transport system kinase
MACLSLNLDKLLYPGGKLLSSLGERVLKGDRSAISRAITVVENGGAERAEILREVYPHTGSAFIVGITGPLGTGKSSLVDLLVQKYREKGRRVGVLAVDPTSPVSGGAILGDRVRMLEHSLDKDVYIRSMASRGAEGGLSRVTRNAARILDAAGFDIIFVETVGTGQTELEIMRVADVIVVVLMPELGDEVQAAKAGLMEIGDIFAINKSDLPGADKVLYNMSSFLSTTGDGWHQIAVKVSAKTPQGVEELVGEIEKFREAEKSSKVPRKRNILADELLEAVIQGVSDDLSKRLLRDKEFHSLVDRLVKMEVDPDAAADELLKKYSFE